MQTCYTRRAPSIKAHATATAAYPSTRGTSWQQTPVCLCLSSNPKPARDDQPRRRLFRPKRYPNLFGFPFPHFRPSLPPKHPLQPQPSPLGPRPRRRRVEVPHQVLVVGRVAARGEHAARGGLGGGGGRVLAQVPVAQEGDEGVDLGCRVFVAAGELVGLGQALREDVLELAGWAERVFWPVG